MWFPLATAISISFYFKKWLVQAFTFSLFYFQKPPVWTLRVEELILHSYSWHWRNYEAVEKKLHDSSQAIEFNQLFFFFISRLFQLAMVVNTFLRRMKKLKICEVSRFWLNSLLFSFVLNYLKCFQNLTNKAEVITFSQKTYF